MQQQQHHNCCLCNCLTTCYCLPASATACSKPLNTATPLWWRNFGSALLRTPVVGGCLRVRKLLLYSTATVHYADGQSRALQVEVGQRGAGGPGAGAAIDAAAEQVCMWGEAALGGFPL